MNRSASFTSITALLSLVAAVPAQARSDNDDFDDDRKGGVFVLTNDANANAVVAYERAADGSLALTGSFPTGGQGSGDGLGSQGALVLSQDKHLLFAVDAGNSELVAFRVDGSHLQVASRISTGGTRPISVTEHHGLVYVLNAGGSGGVQGFRTSFDGKLSPIAGAAGALSGNGVGPAQVQFTNEGGSLIVTEKATNRIDVFDLDWNGTVRNAAYNAAAGTTPFGFGITRDGTLIVSEASGGAAGAGTASSYDVRRNGTLDVLGNHVADDQSAPCWIAVNRRGDFAYTTNAASGTLSAFHVDSRGGLQLRDAGGVTADLGATSHPVDLAFDQGGHHLYVLAGGLHGIASFEAHRDGGLTSLETGNGLPATAVGIAAY